MPPSPWFSPLLSPFPSGLYPSPSIYVPQNSRPLAIPGSRRASLHPGMGGSGEQTQEACLGLFGQEAPDLRIPERGLERGVVPARDGHFHLPPGWSLGPFYFLPNNTWVPSTSCRIIHKPP